MAMAPEEIVSRVLGIERAAVRDDTSHNTLAEWDSLAHVTLIVALEATYEVSLSAEDAIAMTDVATIKLVLSSRGASW
jgi:acyl carrier protein